MSFGFPGVVVTGSNSALLWADGDIFSVGVTSSGGSAVAIGYGNATLLNVSGAAAIVTGTTIGWVSGTDFAENENGAQLISVGWALMATSEFVNASRTSRSSWRLGVPRFESSRGSTGVV